MSAHVEVPGRIRHAAEVMELAGMGTVTVADLRTAAAAVAELIEADKAYDLALGALENYYRTVSEKGYAAAQFFDARALQHAFVHADSRRCLALLALAPVKDSSP